MSRGTTDTRAPVLHECCKHHTSPNWTHPSPLICSLLPSLFLSWVPNRMGLGQPPGLSYWSILLSPPNTWSTHSLHLPISNLLYSPFFTVKMIFPKGDSGYVNSPSPVLLPVLGRRLLAALRVSPRPFTDSQGALRGKDPPSSLRLSVFCSRVPSGPAKQLFRVLKHTHILFHFQVSVYFSPFSLSAWPTVLRFTGRSTGPGPSLPGPLRCAHPHHSARRPHRA